MSFCPNDVCPNVIYPNVLCPIVFCPNDVCPNDVCPNSFFEQNARCQAAFRFCSVFKKLCEEQKNHDRNWIFKFLAASQATQVFQGQSKYVPISVRSARNVQIQNNFVYFGTA
jgi:hypothetical protein